MRISARGWSMWFSARVDASTRSVKSRGAATRMRICISARLARLEGPPNCTLAVPIGVRMITDPLLLIAASTLLGIAGFAGLLHLIPRLGAAGTRISAWLCRAPGLDLRPRAGQPPIRARTAHRHLPQPHRRTVQQPRRSLGDRARPPRLHRPPRGRAGHLPDPHAPGGPAAISPRGLGERQPPEVPRPGGTRPDLVPVL